MSVIEETRFLMKKYGIKANKSLGQNFLINEDALESIVQSADISKKDLIIEIGPGLGTLTKYLLEKAGKVVCIEIDNKMISILKDRFSLYNNFEIINKDVLKVDLSKLISEKKGKDTILNVKIVANLPYYITTPIIMKLLEDKLDIESITVMVQKEVADRLIAIPGEKLAGAITYTVYYYCESKKIMEVRSDSFIPEPEVTSEIIKLKVRKKPVVYVEDERLFFNIIKSAFMQRRKTLINSLTNNHIFESKKDGEIILNELDFDLNIRAENLSIQDFEKIYNKIKQ